eukprot:gnl/MRDRNA2_/MRDRNA2_117643_c0_seq1.p1 gnl/MRDRNA2_/MRDRNA2_117643_c0~~gnl/MRDRNA2_/MRDRNA2_117643_c0_seq1.p1  ORF type:complete len:492 (+),score=86.04 gnl/MRDRNA2_/MRDRNA2_117643_c0_seq1:148-1623(+)
MSNSTGWDERVLRDSDASWDGLIGGLATGAFVNFWVFDWSEAFQIHTLLCAIFLALGGVLCAAAGIGGGGIIVTVLMTVGQLSPYDAVPLSKAVVFFGAMMQLVLNWGKKAIQQDEDGEQEKDLIDWHVVRLIVPMALTGTLMGVVFNFGTPGGIIVILLSATLIVMFLTVVHKGLEQYRKESQLLDQDTENTSLISRSNVQGYSQGSEACGGQLRRRRPSASSSSSGLGTWPEPKVEDFEQTNIRGPVNQAALAALLFLVVSCGVLRHHMGFCLEELHRGQLTTADGAASACHHPILQVLFGDSMERWMKSSGNAMGFMIMVMILPVTMCLMIGFHFAQDMEVSRGWDKPKIWTYQIMALITGTLAGLVGIGGGLIFSPFLIMTGMEPSVAVASSAACVIFTSSSTTIQYLLIDRVRMVLALIYGLVNVAASYSGTKCIHFIQDEYVGRKSYITFIVAIAVGVSAILALVKAVQEFESPSDGLNTPIRGA